MSAGTSELTPAQARFLSRTLDEVHLSVRASNCLKNMNVRYLGELAQYNPTELMRIPNFGRKSLGEIIALFAEENLSLGLDIPGWAPDLTVVSVAKTANSQTSLNTLQCAFLAKRLEEFDLSVRTSNCLNTLNIEYLGELIQYTPAELMQINAFGKKSLQELKELFAAVNLPLGLQIPNWTPEFAGPVPIKEPVSPNMGERDADSLTSTQKAFLAQPIGRFNLSKRVAALIESHKVARIGDLAILSADQAKALVESDRAALREVAGLLACEHLYFGVGIPCWNAELAAEWEQAYPSEAQELAKRHALAVTGAIAVASYSLEEELENLVRSTVKGISDRNFSIVAQFFGFDGAGKKTLEEVGQIFDVTRERIRQITSKFSKRVHDRGLYLPTLRLACRQILDCLPSTSGAISRSLQKQGITRTEFDISGIVAAARLLEEDDILDIASIGEGGLIVRNNEANYFKLVPRMARAIVRAFGCGHIEHILADLETEPGRTIEAHQVANILNRNPEIRWLNQEHEWFTIVEAKRNRLSNIVRKVLSVAPKISHLELRGAIKRVHRLDGFAPPSEILKAFCASLPFCDVAGEDVVASQSIALSETLGEIERSFYDVLRQHGPAMNIGALREECLKRGMNANSFYQYVTYSPIICRLVREIYALVGADVPPGTVEMIPQPSAKAPVLIGHGWTDDGRIWISYRLNASNVRSGVFTLPSALKGILSGHFSVQSSGTGSRTVISTDDDRLIGLHRPIAIRGGQPDDLIIVAIDIRHGNAEVRFAEEIEGSNEATEAVVAHTLPSTAATNLEDRTPLIMGSDLTGDDKDWQPMSSAPVGQELEVRLEDTFGRYVLMFPCKLVPGQGWINSRLETPLPAAPVDWKYWDESSLQF
jgi:hypothetical protein